MILQERFQGWMYKMTDTKPTTQKLTGKAKLAVELGPLIVFLVGYFLSPKLAPKLGNLIGQNWSVCTGEEMYVAVAAFIPAFLVAFAFSAWKEKRVAPMLLVTGAIVIVLGGLTLLLHDKRFFYMKPTITYLLFAAIFAGGLQTGRNFLKMMFDGAFQMPEAAWRILTWRFVALYVGLAIANEIAWRVLASGCLPPPGTETLIRDAAGVCLTGSECAGEKTWVNLKIFGFTGAYFLFMFAQAPFLMKHMEEDQV